MFKKYVEVILSPDPSPQSANVQRPYPSPSDVLNSLANKHDAANHQDSMKINIFYLFITRHALKTA